MANVVIEPVARLIEAFARLPGIGPKTAQRLTFHLLRASDAEARLTAARTERDAYATIDDINLVSDTGLCRQSVLFSTRCFKQSGARFRNPGALN